MDEMFVHVLGEIHQESDFLLIVRRGGVCAERVDCVTEVVILGGPRQRERNRKSVNRTCTSDAWPTKVI